MINSLFTVRIATAADALSITRLKNAVIADTQYLLETSNEANQDPVATSRQIEFLSKNGRLFLVAVSGSEIVGCLTFGRHDFQKIRHRGGLQMMVSPDHQGMGIGTKLLSHFLVLARNQVDLERIDISVMSGNHAAIHLYEKFGFALEGRRPKAFRLSDTIYEDELFLGLILK